MVNNEINLKYIIFWNHFVIYLQPLRYFVRISFDNSHTEPIIINKTNLINSLINLINKHKIKEIKET